MALKNEISEIKNQTVGFFASKYSICFPTVVDATTQHMAPATIILTFLGLEKIRKKVGTR